jgi:hypothetical protein
MSCIAWATLPTKQLNFWKVAMAASCQGVTPDGRTVIGPALKVEVSPSLFSPSSAV